MNTQFAGVHDSIDRKKSGPLRQNTHLAVEQLLEHASREPVGRWSGVVDDGERQLLAFALHGYPRYRELSRVDGEVHELVRGVPSGCGRGCEPR